MLVVHYEKTWPTQSCVAMPVVIEHDGERYRCLRVEEERACAVCARCVRTSTPTLSSSESESVFATVVAVVVAAAAAAVVAIVVVSVLVTVASEVGSTAEGGDEKVGGAMSDDFEEEENTPSFSLSDSFSLARSLTLV